MTLPSNFVSAIYKDPGIERYRGNPFIEALLTKLLLTIYKLLNFFFLFTK